MPDHAFKYLYELLNPDGTIRSNLEIIVFFWKNSETNTTIPTPEEIAATLEQHTAHPPADAVRGILILYIRDEHQNDYELSDFPDGVKQAILNEIKRFLNTEGQP
jgi:hypothetical protein